MAFNQAGGAQVPLSVFGGRVTEMAPPDLPEGVSPDEGDQVFAPGSTGSRPALQKVFAVQFPKGSAAFVGTCTYAKSSVLPASTYNLYLDSNGNLWAEDVVGSPGTYSVLSSVFAPGSYAKSITAFNREYIAVSDKLHGADVPLQWDGTNLDRVTQDGPGAAPQVVSLALPPVAMALSSAAVACNITSIVTSDQTYEGPPPAYGGGGFYIWLTITITLSSGTSPTVGTGVTISGNTNATFNKTFYCSAVVSNTVFKCSCGILGSIQTGTGGSFLATSGGVTAVRAGSLVTISTTAAHNLLVGYQAQVGGLPPMTVGTSISSIVINNESLPGVALVTMTTAHGLVPGLYVSITGVSAVAVGGAIVSIVRAGQVVTVTTTGGHGLSPGAVVQIAGVTNTSFNTIATVANVISPTVYTFLQVDVDASSSAGTTSLTWPIPTTATPQYFQVLSCPSATTFQVALNYSDSTFTTGTVTYAWNGTFFVSAVPSPTSFQYQQFGPDALSTTVGTVTPFGQAAPGQHQCQVLFLTRQGAITRPSPAVSFQANGGQYISVANIPIGPPNVVARILAFTGAQGAYFFYLPAPSQINGQAVASATQINDNTSTSALLDFSDNSLFAGLGISIPGNTLSNQIVLDGALGFGLYGGRLLAWGQRNRIQNLLSMSFDGGHLGGQSNPLGWDASANAGGAVAAGHFGMGWNVASGQAGTLSQSLCRDAIGAPVTHPNTAYLFRCWAKGAGSVNAVMSSVSTGFSASASIASSPTGAFAQAPFSAKTPGEIPADLILTLSVSGSTTDVLIDECSLIYADTPFTDALVFASYVDNPEGFDGLTGKFGSSQDAHKVMDLSDIRQTLYFLTQDPGGRLHETSDNGTTEPAGWAVRQVAANCGLLSAFALTKSQADDASASGGEEWFAWGSTTGARIFSGGEPWKITQEIDPDWQIVNKAAYLTAWTLNDPISKLLFFGLPVGAAVAPSKVYVMNYRGLGTASDIGNTGPVRISYSGRLIATDHSRKWTRWNLAIGCAALMWRGVGDLEPVFGAGASYGNAYTLSASKLTDDDYGQINPYYVTFFIPSSDQEINFQLGGTRKMLAFVSSFCSGVGKLSVTPLCDSLTNPWPIGTTWPLSANPKHDLTWGGGQALGERIALKMASSPATGTDNSFAIQKLTVWMRRVAHLSVRGGL